MERMRSTVHRVSDMVRDMVPFLRYQMTPAESDLSIHLRGNEVLYKALTGLLHDRIAGRAKVQEPSDPLVCKSFLARDRELQWVLNRLEFIYRSPVNPPGGVAEQPGRPGTAEE